MGYVMKKLVSVRNGMIVILCITIICLGIGFIILSMELDKEKKTDKVYDVSFVEVSKISSVSGGSVEPVGNISIEDDGKLLNMDFTMNNARDELNYNITIQNNGTVDAEVLDLIESPEYYKGAFKTSLLPVSISFSDVSEKILEAGDSTDVKLNVVYNYSTVTGVKKFNYKLGLLSKSI